MSTHTPPALAGSSLEVTRARHAAQAAMAERTPLLLIAEEGFDPTAIAQWIHEASRPGQPFVLVSPAREEPADIEASLFGASSRSPAQPVEVLGAGSAFIRAGHGTVFIDGIGELPAVVQRRLARLLRDGEAKASGRVPAPVQARVIASAQPTIHGDVNEGRVRADLYRRLASQEIVVPPLRTRPGDFATLVPAVAAVVSRRLDRPVPTFTQSALTVLAALPWRRNLEELDGLLERILRAAPDDGIKQEDVLAQLSFDGAFSRRAPSASLREARLRFEREYIAAVLEQHHWRMSDAARALGIERANLYRKTRQLGISRAMPAQPAASR
ncbi:MAG TPA: sigma 54-interacting transcriptional regulator [Vicinamibacterales bacterium]|nr:sigma 54-interacting transcriptional regulator [Vicinamibacterales bacterium]